jgi:hypothetical protein
MAGNWIQRTFGKGQNAQGEYLARFPKDEINAWRMRLVDSQVEHLQAGDILLKMNFTMDEMPVANVISTGQRLLQSYEDASYAIGHVAIAIDSLRLAEQTGAGVSINTLGVTDKNVAEHKIDHVYYYVWRCKCRQVREAAAKLAESFAIGCPLTNRNAGLQAGIGGQYDLKSALKSVFKRRTATVANPTGGNNEIRLDAWSQNIFDYCNGITHMREDMFCSAFVLAVYQAACLHVATQQAIQGNNLQSGQQARACLLKLDPINTTPRSYEVRLRGSSEYTEEGVFRYVDLDSLNKTKLAASRIFANLSQALDNYANFVTTGEFKASGSTRLQTEVEAIVNQRIEVLKKMDEESKNQAAQPAAAQPSRFARFFGTPSKQEKTPAEIAFGKAPTNYRKQAIQQVVTQEDNEDYQNLKNFRDLVLSERNADPEYFSGQVNLFRTMCEVLKAKGMKGVIRGSILRQFLIHSLEAVRDVRDTETRTRNRRAGGLGNVDFDAVLAGNFG